MHPISQRLHELRGRVWRLRLAYGLGWCIAIGVTAVLACGWADFWLHFQDRGIRVLSLIGLVAVVAAAAHRFLYRTLRASPGDLSLARRVQDRFPELGDRLENAVDFLTRSDNDDTAGALALRQATIDDAAKRINPLDFEQVVDPRPMRRAIAATLAATVIAAGAIGFWPDLCRLAAARLVNPFDDTAWPRYNRLALRTVVRQVARGYPFEIEVFDERGRPMPDDAKIQYRFDVPDGAPAIETEPLRRLGDSLVARRENVSRPFAYRVEGGDDHAMDWIDVEIVDPPALDWLKIRAIPPEYTGLPAVDAQRQLRALAGTRLEWSGKATRPIAGAALCWENGRRTQARLDDLMHFRIPAGADAPLEKSQSFWIELTTPDGLTVQAGERGHVSVVPDAPPAVSIERPTGDLFVTAKAVIPLTVRAKDDLSVRRADLVWIRSDRSDAEPERTELYVRAARRKNPAAEDVQLLEKEWDLRPLGLKPGTLVTYRAEATDDQSATSRSEPRLLHVISEEEWNDRLALQQTRILSELTRILGLQQTVGSQVAAIADRLKKSQQPTQLDVDHLQAAGMGQRQVDRLLINRAEGVPALIESLLADLENHRQKKPELRRQYEGLAQELTRWAMEFLSPIGRDMTDAIRATQLAFGSSGDSGSRESARVALQKTVDNQKRLEAALKKEIERLGHWEGYRRFVREAMQLMRAQEELSGRTAALGRQTLTRSLADLAPNQLADLKSLARSQLDLTGQFEQFRESMAETAARSRDAEPQAAKLLGQALAHLQATEPGDRMENSRMAIEANRMGQAVSQQKQVVADLKELISILVGKSSQGGHDDPDGEPKPPENGPINPGIDKADERNKPPPSKVTGQKPGIPPKTAAKPAGSEPITQPQLRAIQSQFWGKLPNKVREAILQSAVEEFLPKYEHEIERYYRRLSEEKGQK